MNLKTQFKLFLAFGLFNGLMGNKARLAMETNKQMRMQIGSVVSLVSEFEPPLGDYTLG